MDVKKIVEAFLLEDVEALSRHIGITEETVEEFATKFGELIANISPEDYEGVLNLLANGDAGMADLLVDSYMRPYLKKEQIKDFLEDPAKYHLEGMSIVSLVESLPVEERLEIIKDCIEKRKEYQLLPWHITDLILSAENVEYAKECVERKDELMLRSSEVCQVIKSTDDIKYIQDIIRRREDYELSGIDIADIAMGIHEPEVVDCVFEQLESGEISRIVASQMILATENPEYIARCIKNKEQYNLGLDQQIEMLPHTNWGFVVEPDEMPGRDIFNDNAEKKLSNGADKSKVTLPYAFAKQLSEAGVFERFCEESDFRFFKSELPQIDEMFANTSEVERECFYKFATALGCFSKEKIKDKDGRETDKLLAPKACSMLAKLIKTRQLEPGNYRYLFRSLPVNQTTSQAFLKFISEETTQKIKDESGRTIRKETTFPNLEMLASLEQNYPGIFGKTMICFDAVKESRYTLTEEGKVTKLSWEDAVIEYYVGNPYMGITKDNEDIARVAKSKNLSQETFEKMVELRQNAQKNGVPEHLLGTEIREETIEETIARVRNATAEELGEAKQLADDLFDKEFTYEWLSKNDPRNGIMGLYCSCCGTITSQAYGKNVADASVTAKDVQNLIVRNAKREIIAKGTMYLDSVHGYGVINDFELNEEYRKGEKDRSGRYDDTGIAGEIAAEKRDRIFAAFQRGIAAFVEEYDSQNPESPLRQINVGMGYNRLKKHVEQYEKATELLTVPTEYSFMDAAQEQYVLYDREQAMRERGVKPQAKDDGRGQRI